MPSVDGYRECLEMYYTPCKCNAPFVVWRDNVNMVLEGVDGAKDFFLIPEDARLSQVHQNTVSKQLFVKH